MCAQTGAPEPLGPSKQGTAVNFALYGKEANSVTLCLYDESNSYITELPMNKTGRRGSMEYLPHTVSAPPPPVLHGIRTLYNVSPPYHQRSLCRQQYTRKPYIFCS